MIPKTIHQIHLGPHELSPQELSWRDSWSQLNTGWQYKLWLDEHVKELELPKCVMESCANYAELSDVYRLKILQIYGGLYIDTDFACLKSIDPLFSQKRFAVFRQDEKTINNACISSAPNTPQITKLVDGLLDRAVWYKNCMNKYGHWDCHPIVTIRKFNWMDNSSYKFGPEYLTSTLGIQTAIPDGVGCDIKKVYPFDWKEPHRVDENFRETTPEAYAVHYWNTSWLS